MRLFAAHVACASVNLRQTLASGVETGTTDVVRTVFDVRKTETELQREIMRADRFKRDVSICIIEATNLRLLRERFGPALTEQVLERAGEALAAQSRDIDVIGQYKESGFTMVLSEVSPTASNWPRGGCSRRRRKQGETRACQGWSCTSHAAGRRGPQMARPSRRYSRQRSAGCTTRRPRSRSARNPRTRSNTKALAMRGPWSDLDRIVLRPPGLRWRRP